MNTVRDQLGRVYNIDIHGNFNSEDKTWELECPGCAEMFVCESRQGGRMFCSENCKAAYHMRAYRKRLKEGK